MAILIAITILLIISIAIMFFMLKKTFAELNNKSKQYFTKKGQEYLEEIKVEKKETKEEEQVSDKKEEKKEAFICVDNENKYEINNIFEIVKKVNEKFDFNFEEIIKSFISKNVKTKENTKYEKLKEMQQYIDNIGLYNILTNESSEFIDKMKKDLRGIDNGIFKEYYSGKKKFDIQDFDNYLKNEMEKNDPYVYVYVGDKNINFDYLGEIVKTIYSKEISKGIRIVYKNCMYDYSLS